MASQIKIEHETPLTLKVTGARDETGGSGIKSYSIYYAIVESGIQAPTVDDAQLLTTIDHLTSIPSTLDPAGETTSGYPSWEASETASGITRDHYHWDHVFEYEWDGWQSNNYHYFWCLAEDFAGNSSILISGVHPSNPFYPGMDEQVILARNIEPKASVNNNVFLITGKGNVGWQYYSLDGGLTQYVTVPSDS
jgi:hypothetical protein